MQPFAIFFFACFGMTATAASFTAPAPTTATGPSMTCSTALATPKPSNIFCGIQGSIFQPTPNPYLINLSQVTNFTTCRDACLNDTSCALFSYSTSKPPGPVKNYCRTFSAPLGTMGFSRAVTGPHPYGFFFYSRYCFQVTCVTPPKPSKPFVLRAFGTYTDVDGLYAELISVPGVDSYVISFSAPGTGGAQNFTLDGGQLIAAVNGDNYVAALPNDGSSVENVALEKAAALGGRALSCSRVDVSSVTGEGRLTCEYGDACDVLQVVEGQSVLRIGDQLDEDEVEAWAIPA